MHVFSGVRCFNEHTSEQSRNPSVKSTRCDEEGDKQMEDSGSGALVIHAGPGVNLRPPVHRPQSAEGALR